MTARTAAFDRPGATEWPSAPAELPAIYRALALDRGAESPPPRPHWTQSNQRLHHELVVDGKEPPRRISKRPTTAGERPTFVYSFREWMKTAGGYCAAWLKSTSAWRSPLTWPNPVRAEDRLGLEPWIVAEGALPYDLASQPEVIALQAFAQGIWGRGAGKNGIRWGERFAPDLINPEVMAVGMRTLTHDPRVQIAMAARHVRFLPGIRIYDDYLENLRRVEWCLRFPFHTTPRDQAAFLESFVFLEALASSRRCNGRPPTMKMELPPRWSQWSYRVTTPPGKVVEGASGAEGNGQEDEGQHEAEG